MALDNDVVSICDGSVFWSLSCPGSLEFDETPDASLWSAGVAKGSVVVDVVWDRSPNGSRNGSMPDDSIGGVGICGSAAGTEGLSCGRVGDTCMLSTGGATSTDGAMLSPELPADATELPVHASCPFRSDALTAVRP